MCPLYRSFRTKSFLWKTFIQECSDSDRDTEILSSDSPASESTAVPDLKRTESVFRQYLQTETSLSLRIKTGMQSNNENLVSHLQCPKRQYLQTETSLSLRIKTGMQSNTKNPVSLHCLKRKYLQTETSQSLRVSTGMQNNTENLSQIQGSKFSALQAALPPAVHLLTLSQWDSESVLLRLEHQYESGESKAFSQPVTLDLQKLFSTLEVLGASEMSLGANQWKEDMTRLQWNSSDGEGVGPLWVGLRDPSPSEITLNPMEIRTFLLRVRQR
ncbi:hypothetical protein MHYP_G00302490 [Metynnis hypsauchen]